MCAVGARIDDGFFLSTVHWLSVPTADDPAPTRWIELQGDEVAVKRWVHMLPWHKST